MFNRQITWVAAIFLVLQFGVYTVSAIIGCAAEANFQACKSIEVSLLNGCGPVDYSCQCSAQKLIHQCYNLCPEYSIDANEQARIATSICVAVPTTSAAPVTSGSHVGPSQASPTWVAPATTGSTSTPSSSPSVSSSFGVQITPATGFMSVILVLGFVFQF
ncbi:hypothetical protein INT47_002003 [Mucor saturninus]|uniref:Extracellular membrane protein CFEM domain-containing protein n=1 Tax=Mucor saturninus TaxID=64648 RepID=A0A8H7V390_9FUNG|nr:hypothetical protein INT47_002003 [Mucor saturninus]